MVPHPASHCDRSGITVQRHVVVHLIRTTSFRTTIVPVEVDVRRRHTHHQSGIIARVRGRETERSKSVVLQGFLGAFEHGGLVAVHVGHHHLVDLRLFLIADHIMMRLPIGIMAHHFIGLIPSATAEQGIATGVLHHEFHERASRRIAAREFVSREVGQFHRDESCVGRAVHHFVLHQQGLVLEQSRSACDGAVELHRIGCQQQFLAIVLEQVQHEGVATDQIVFAVRRAQVFLRGEEIIQCGDHHGLIHARHMATLAGHPTFWVDVRVEHRVQPFVIGGLLHELVARGVPFQVGGFCDQRVATRTKTGVSDMLTILGCITNKGLHGSTEEVLCIDRSVDHIVQVELQRSGEELPDAVCTLHVAREAGDAVHGHRIRRHFSDGVVSTAGQEFVIATHGCMA